MALDGCHRRLARCRRPGRRARQVSSARAGRPAAGQRALPLRAHEPRPGPARAGVARAQGPGSAVPVSPTLTPNPKRTAADAVEALIAQVSSPVRWERGGPPCVEGVTTYVEVSPGTGSERTGRKVLARPRHQLGSPATRRPSRRIFMFESHRRVRSLPVRLAESAGRSPRGSPRRARSSSRPLGATTPRRPWPRLPERRRAEAVGADVTDAVALGPLPEAVADRHGRLDTYQQRRRDADQLCCG